MLTTENALFEAWDSLENFRSDLVVVGGLAVHYHTRDLTNALYLGAPTLDVDFGISLGTDAGMKGTVQFDLLQAGYESVGDRMVKTLESGEKFYIDFLTEHPPSEQGSRNISDIIASICPGINRALSLAEANREIDKLLKQGVKVSFPDQEHGGQRVEVVSVVDWEVPENNDFLLGSQFWVAGELYLKRPDLVGFVNGLPLVLIELKKPGVNVREGFDKNLRDYKQTIPQLFHYNALLLVSNGVQSKIGSLTAEWEHFGDWKKATSEEDVAGISLETLLRGTCEKGRLLDLIENFTRFVDDKGRTSKLLARNHQFHGVNRAIAVLSRLCHPQITLTPALSQGERGQEAPHYRGGFQFAGIPDDEVLRFASADQRAVLTRNRQDFIRLHRHNPDHHGIIVCTVDADFPALAARIHAQLQATDSLQRQLLRINRGG